MALFHVIVAITSPKTLITPSGPSHCTFSGEPTRTSSGLPFISFVPPSRRRPGTPVALASHTFCHQLPPTPHPGDTANCHFRSCVTRRVFSPLILSITSKVQFPAVFQLNILSMFIRMYRKIENRSTVWRKDGKVTQCAVEL